MAASSIFEEPPSLVGEASLLLRAMLEPISGADISAIVNQCFTCTPASSKRMPEKR